MRRCSSAVIARYALVLPPYPSLQAPPLPSSSSTLFDERPSPTRDASSKLNSHATIRGYAHAQGAIVRRRVFEAPVCHATVGRLA